MMTLEEYIEAYEERFAGIGDLTDVSYLM